MLILSFIVLCWVLWVFFVAVMRLQMVKAENKLSPGMKVLGYPTMLVGVSIDVLVQILISLPLLEFPREWTVSGRLWRLSNGADGWRKKAAIWIRYQFLDSIDPRGYHSGK